MLSKQKMRRYANGERREEARPTEWGPPAFGGLAPYGDDRLLYGCAVRTACAAADDDMWTRFSEIIANVYGELLGISTIVAVTAAAVALLVRMISRNERAVAEATSWLKRIVVTWIVLNTLGFIVAYLQPLIEGGKYTPPK